MMDLMSTRQRAVQHICKGTQHTSRRSECVLTLKAPGSHPGNKDLRIFLVASWVCLGCLCLEFSLRVRSMMASYLHIVWMIKAKAR